MGHFFKFFIYLFFSFFIISCNDKGKQENQTTINPNAKNSKQEISQDKQEIKSKQDTQLLRPRNESNTESDYKENIPSVINNKGYKVIAKANFNKEAGEIAELFKKIKKPSQVFSINPKRDTVLVCKEGTRLSIPAFGFTYENGMPVRDSIKFEVTEFLSKKDFLLASLSTSSDGAMLETGGMLEIKTFSRGKEVKLRKNTSVLVEVPTQKMMPDMELFYGNHDSHGRVNWKQENSKEEKFLKDRKKAKPMKQFANVMRVTSYIDTTGKVFNEDKEAHEWADSARKTEKMDSVEFSYIVNRKGEIKDGPIYYNNKLAKFGKLKFGYNDYVGLRGYYRPKYTRKLNFNTYYTIEVSGISYRYYLDEEQLKKIKRQIKETKGSVTVRVKQVYCKTDTLLIYNYEKYRKFMRENAMNYLKSDTVAIKTLQTSYYAFEATQLSWINIDRFYKSKTQMVPFAVKTEEGRYADVKVVFKSINSVLSGLNVLGRSDFETMPQGEQVTVVAIMIKEGITFLAIKNISIQSGIVDGLDFQAVSPQELKTKIGQIF
jgi:hypothetical protein